MFSLITVERKAQLGRRTDLLGEMPFVPTKYIMNDLRAYVIVDHRPFPLTKFLHIVHMSIFIDRTPGHMIDIPEL
jgi:hypothetical protein